MTPTLSAFGVGFDVRNPLVEGVMQQLGMHITHITDTTRQAVMDVIDQAWQDGVGIDEAARRLRSQVGGLTLDRASVIARTEMLAAVNGANLAAVRITGAAAYKTWMATNDARTRQTHRTADGQAVALDEAFDVGGYRLQWPGDPSGPGDEIIQCRCTMLYGDTASGEQTILGSGGTMPPTKHDVIAALQGSSGERIQELFRGHPTGRLSRITMTLTADAQAGADGRVGWTGDGIMYVDTETGDGRRFDSPANADGWPADQVVDTPTAWHRPLPLPLMAMFDDNHGGWTDPLSTLTGQITELSIDGNKVKAAGTFDATPAGERHRLAVESGSMATVSADPLPVQWTVEIPLDFTDEGVIAPDENGREVWTFTETISDYGHVTFNKWTLAGLTGVPFPAFGDDGQVAQISLTAGAIASDANTSVEIDGAQADADTVTAVEAAVAGALADDVTVTSVTVVGETATASNDDQADDSGDGDLQASGATREEPVMQHAAPSAWFEQPEPDHPQPLRFEADGRVHGHVAAWGVCHTGLGVSLAADNTGECVLTPESGSGYAYYHTGEYVTADGDTVYVGRITMDAPHADAGMSRQRVMDHYDHTASHLAYVTVHDGKWGIWACGTIAPDVTPSQLARARACPPSGDWRNVNGDLEMMGVLMVNVAGFPVPRLVAAGAHDGRPGEIIALFSAGSGPIPPEPIDKAALRLIREGSSALLATIRG